LIGPDFPFDLANSLASGDSPARRTPNNAYKRIIDTEGDEAIFTVMGPSTMPASRTNKRHIEALWEQEWYTKATEIIESRFFKVRVICLLLFHHLLTSFVIQLFENMCISRPSSGSGRYLIWLLNMTWFQELNADGIALDLVGKLPKCKQSDRAGPRGYLKGFVVLDMISGNPLGKTLDMLAKRPHRANGLAVQLSGNPNKIPCKACLEAWCLGDTETQYGSAPFFGCVSNKAYMSGFRCGLCAFKEQKCSHEEFVGPAHRTYGPYVLALPDLKLDIDMRHWSSDFQWLPADLKEFAKQWNKRAVQEKKRLADLEKQKKKDARMAKRTSTAVTGDDSENDDMDFA
jgi:hypothetical protein